MVRKGQRQLRRAARRLIAVAQDVALQQRRGGPCGAEPDHARLDPVVPGGAGLIPALPAGHDQPLLRPGERDIEQPTVLLLLRHDRGLVCGAARAVPQTAPHAPDRQAVLLGPQQPVPGVRPEGGIRDEHDRGLETLGAVAGQHAHFVTRPVGVADQLRAVGAQPVQERLHGWRMALLEGERLGEKRFDRLGRGRTEPGEQAPAAAALAEQANVELEGRQKVDLRQQLMQALVRWRKGGRSRAACRRW